MWERRVVGPLMVAGALHGACTSSAGRPKNADANDPGDGTCACDATGPACVRWFESHCWGTVTCPPTLANSLKAETWGTRSDFNKNAGYTTCSDGTRSFFDAGFEYHVVFDFDAQGALVYEFNDAIGGVICGAPVGAAGGSASGDATCRSCDILEAAGAGGAANDGAAGASGAGSEVPACLVEGGVLVMPPR